MWKARLRHKGLFVVIAPLICDVLLFFGLISLLHQAEAEIASEARSKEVTFHTYKMFNAETCAATNLISLFLQNNSKNSMRGHKRNIGLVQEELEILSKLLENDPAQKDNLKRLKIGHRKFEKRFARLSEKADSNSGFMSLMEEMATLSAIEEDMSFLGNAVEAIEDTEIRLSEISRIQQAENRKKIQTLVLGGIGFNACLAVLLSIFFSRSIAARLQILTDNTSRFSRGQPLNEPLSGADEIAELDAVFHSMVQEVKTADEMKQRLIGIVSHELRAPLSSVYLALSSTCQGQYGQLPEKAQKKLTHAEADLTRLIALIKDLLDAEKAAAGEIDMYMRSVDLRSAAEAAINSTHSFAETKHVQVNLEGAAAPVYADHDRIVQVLVNLISNAIKYSPEKSTVKVNVQQVDLFGEVRVSDSGRGVPDEFKSVIFNRFRHIEKSDVLEKGGTGLGLWISKMIVEKHKGTIGVDSSEAKGSEFWFRIPLVSDSQADTEPLPAVTADLDP